jgi:dGTPase
MSGIAAKSSSAAAADLPGAESGSIPLYTDQDVKRVANVGEGLSPEPYRSAFRRDYARLIHCPAFRRLQGKAQLFPCQENDFFRNRLTHSLEVAQIAKSIAIRLNDKNTYFAKHNIDTDLVEFAGLAHDIGHPPFGHNGEMELDRQMLEYGGVEGNAQTLRIISKLEKKQTTNYPHSADVPEPIVGNSDNRTGLNPTYRAIASILKYDCQIPRNQEARERKGSDKKPTKGYYYDESDLVRAVKQHVVGPEYQGEFKTIECSIMDIADDIAYSTYDLEDAFKGGFLTPLTILAMPEPFKNGMVAKIRAKIDALYGSLPAEDRAFTVVDYDNTLRRIFSGVLKIDVVSDGQFEPEQYHAMVISMTTGTSESICRNGYYRTEFTSELVGRFIRAVDVEVDERFPSMSKAKLSLDAFIAVEILKTLAFEAIIMSSRLKSAENRGQWIVQQIYGELTATNGYLLMPEDWRALVEATNDDSAWKRRMICDYIAGMTDAYCLGFYDRILGRAAPSVQIQH